MTVDLDEEVTTQEYEILLETCRNTIRSLEVENRNLREQEDAALAALAAVMARTGTAEDLAEAQQQRADVLKGALDDAELDIGELRHVAKLRATADPGSIVEAFPAHLCDALVDIDRSSPDLAKQVLGQLRAGSRALLEAYGVASFERATGEGKEETAVTLTERLWEVSDLVRDRLRTSISQSRSLTDAEITSDVARMRERLLQKQTD